MLYIIKFLYSFLLPPGLFVLLLLALAMRLLVKRQRREAMLLFSVNVLLYASMTPFVSDALIGSLEQKYTPSAAIQSDVIVVLGGGATSGTPDVDGEGNLSGAAGNRLITALRLYRQTGLPIVFSGGQVFADSGNEADIARRELIGMGVPPQSVYAENHSLNTAQNADNTALLLKQHGWSKPLLITSAFHMPRAVMEFQRVGLNVQPYPTDYWVSQPQSIYPGKFSPSGSALGSTGTACKEYVGMLVIWMKSLL
ncbi:YdcF family protein [Paenibacillus campi]|uniref:YdcF family protein n=1 Tax=Paenibacillus campi TaxID=3106031 RepID=UPI002AFE47BC|nr:YdcF family protein [Paenibacillus sp. SGZ-1014]